MARVLLVEDDQEMLDVTARALRLDGHEVLPATDGLQALHRWQADAPDIVLLDVGLPRLNGLEVCRRIREHARTPVILVTAWAEEAQILQGFRLGADDYVTKPFSHRQLAMRIRTILARTRKGPASEPTPRVCVGGATLDTTARTLTLADRSEPVQLTPTEGRLVEVLLRNEGHVVPNARLIERAWGYGEVDAVVLRSHISRLRRKLGLVDGQTETIRSRKTLGYSWHRAPGH
jgi:DNA-binding response OmpR family regulator